MNDLTNMIVKKYCENSQFDAASFSLIGTREYQQDFSGLVIRQKSISAIICDGMGGLNGGEKASREAVKLYISDYLARKNDEPASGFLTREAEKLDELVFQLKDFRGKPLNAGSTMVSVIIDEEGLHWVSAGDSRIYILRDDILVQITKDHNYKLQLNESLESGEITGEKYEAEVSGRQAEALINYLGMGGLKRMDSNSKPFQLNGNDTILLCSDGLYKSLDDHQIMALLKDNQVSSSVAAKRLACMALKQAVKGQDNTTVIVIHNTGMKEEE